MSTVNVAVPGPPDGIFGLKFHQVAIHHPHLYDVVEFWKDAGYRNWTEDNALMKGTECGEQVVRPGSLRFNYEIFPHELEYLRFSDERYFIDDDRDVYEPFISHWSVHVDDLDTKLAEVKDEIGIDPFFKYHTIKHTNPGLVASGQLFYECFLDTRMILGHHLKMIQRVYPGDANYPKL